VAGPTLVIVNPASAAGSTGRRWRLVEPRVAEVLGGFETEWTTAPGEALRLAAAATRRGVDRIVVAGGDGTIGEVVTGVLQASSEVEPSLGVSRRPTLGLLPMGSGQDLARTLELPLRLEPALELIASGITRELDAARVELRDAQGAPLERYLLGQASAGLAAETVRRVGRQSKRMGARLGFLVGSVTAIFAHRPHALRIEVDGEEIYEGLISLVVAANGRYFGAGMQVAPLAQPDDGLLEIVLVRGVAPVRLLAALPSIYSGRHLSHPAVSRHPARSLRVESLRTPALVEVDGEGLGMLPMSVDIRPAAIRVLAPLPPRDPDGAERPVDPQEIGA
jgi:YegS/Rv2252/BmrU family lipid kinase